ncbi:MAG: hypothetical protein ABIT08_16920 [Bacteroidia bacterium]
MSKTFLSVEYVNILNLPKDKNALDYIKRILSLQSSSEQNEVIGELFEMHRTSTGFDPLSLSKGRFKRIKAIAFRQILAYIDTEIPAIVNSAEYKDYLKKQNRSMIIFEKLKTIKTKMEKVDFVNIEKEIADLKEQIIVCENRDLLIAFANLFNPLSKEKKKYS